MLATLILIACTFNEPCDPSSHVNDVRVVDMPAAECTMNEPEVIERTREWFEMHPNRYFAGWRCQLGRQERGA